jgi:hypothetical protein
MLELPTQNNIQGQWSTYWWSPHLIRKPRGIIKSIAKIPSDDRSTMITLSPSIICRVSTGVNQERHAGSIGSSYLTNLFGPSLRPLRIGAFCRSPRPATSSTGSPASHPFLLPGPAKQCRRKQPTTRSRLRPLASDDASDSRATPVAYASPGMRWVCRLCKSRADGCLMCQMRWTAAEVLVMSIASIGMPI